jgi:hypothetical protein
MWIIITWQCISPQFNVKDCKKCCISNAVDGNVRSECEEDEGTDCEDGDNDSDWCIKCM